MQQKKDKLKALVWDDNGFILIYKRLEEGKLQWPQTSSEARLITHQEVRWILEGLSIDQPKVLRKVTVSDVY